MSKDIEFFLYTRTDCSLCDIFKGELDRKGLSYRSIDIDIDPELVHRYGARIPVLVSGHTEVCEGRFDGNRLDAYIQSEA
jgi:hypothetical protein